MRKLCGKTLQPDDVIINVTIWTNSVGRWKYKRSTTSGRKDTYTELKQSLWKELSSFGLGFPFAKLLRNFCGTKRKIFLSLRISFARKNNNLRNHSQKSFRAKLPYSAFAKRKICAIPQFRSKIRNRLSSKSLDNFSFGHAYFLKVDSSGIGYFLALFYMR